MDGGDVRLHGFEDIWVSNDIVSFQRNVAFDEHHDY